MRTKLRSKISLLFVACAVLVAIPAIAAFADNLQDEVTSGGGTQTIATGAANGFTNTYRIVGNGVDGCNVDSANPATFNVNAPSQVTTSTPTLTFTDCGAAGEKTVTFSSNTVNATGYTINPTYASGGKPGNNGWNLTSAELTLKVVAAPTVTAVTPTDEATGVAVGSNVTATFSAAMDATTGDGDPSTITTSTFKLVKDGDATNTALNAAVTYDSSTNKATLNPSADLLPGTKYNATVVSGANGVRTSSGNYTIEQDETWSFTTFNPNTAPTANGQMVSTNEDTAKTITLTGSDPDGNNLSFSTTTQPAHGSLGTIGTPVCDASAKTCSADVTYAPTADYFGADSFKFRVNDGTVNSTEATVTIDVTAVDDPPTAVNDSATVQEDSGATAINVLANDTDADGGSKTITSKTNGSHG